MKRGRDRRLKGRRSSRFLIDEQVISRQVHRPGSGCPRMLPAWALPTGAEAVFLGRSHEGASPGPRCSGPLRCSVWLGSWWVASAWAMISPGVPPHRSLPAWALGSGWPACPAIRGQDGLDERGAEETLVVLGSSQAVRRCERGPGAGPAKSSQAQMIQCSWAFSPK